MPTARLRYSAENCSIAHALEIVGEKWTLLVLREAFYGVKRFADLHAAIGCARNLLSDRLRTLVDCELLEMRPYREDGQRPRAEYHLTEQGRELLPVLVALMQWGDRWSADPGGPPVRVVHRACGEPVRAELTCAAGHRGLTSQDTATEPGPGARLLEPR